MTLASYVDEKINEREQSDSWYPLGLLYKKGGLVHVQDAEDLDHTLCGMLVSDAKHIGPARVMLRRSPGCEKCEAKV